MDTSGPQQISFLLLAIVMSVVTARHMVAVHGACAIKNEKDIHHDYLLNFFGTLFGWGAAYYYLFFRFGHPPDIIDLIILLLAYVGICGYLPHIIINKGFKP